MPTIRLVSNRSGYFDALCPMHELLNTVRSRPGLVLGRTEHPFTSLVAFLDGYSFGYGDARAACGAPAEAAGLVPLDFTTFVASQLGCAQPGGKGWSTFIREQSASEPAAFDLFFRLRESYERLHPSAV